MFLSESEIKRRLEHNKNIAVVPDSVKKGTLLGDNLIIKLFYFEAEATTENGIIEPRYKIGESDGGRPVAYIDDFPFQARGVVMKTGDHDNCKPYKEGDIVWINFRTAINGSYDFLFDKSSPVDKPTGFKRIPTVLVEFIEK